MDAAKITSIVTVDIKLPLTHARWLRTVCQNPLGEGEDPRCRSIREDIFTALKDIPMTDKRDEFRSNLEPR